MRVFVAVFPPGAVRRAAAALIDGLRRPNDGVSWVKEDNLHYTLRFIGEVGDDGARRVADGARDAAARHAAFDAALGGVGAFPNPRRVRVLWLGMTRGGEALEALAKSLEQSLARRGWAPEGRGFTAHLTIGRVREPREDWTESLAAACLPDGAATGFRVDRLAVVESRLHPKGSIYTVRESAALAPAGAAE